MIVRAGTGWQYALADLSLILFLATASALSQTGGKTKVAPPPPPIAAATESEPVAVWSTGSEAPPLRTWLGQFGQDPRLEVRVIVRYVGDTRLAALAQAVQLAESGGPRARHARILVEPGDRAGASVALVYSSETAASGGGSRSGTMIAG
ncbi:hypothetical protein [Novosphingobium jiangmenense]|uniref:Uncharacterized protein n=1 Tax=Novosphingobium jiangmenense TaxID=2791981 RepID=A0ABS0HI95_9SPHN|nr:hypothetical protein [Novosphingobium jiangmenense]MBF9151980.1 hypothetical protein [Novosphingobium jiangmenense]